MTIPPGNEHLSATEAQAILSPYYDHLHNCFVDAWNKWELLRDKYGDFSSAFNARTRANVVNDYLWEAVKTRFSQLSGAHTTTTNGMRVLCLADQLVLRFKKLDKRLRASNIITLQQQSFAKQEPIPGIPELTRLTIGYVLNRFHTDIDMVVVTLRSGSSLIWHFTIPANANQAGATPFIEDDVDVTRQRRIKPKRTDEGEELTGS